MALALVGRRSVAAVIAALSILILGAGCGTFEDAANWDVTLRNDTHHSVVIRACNSSSCSSYRYTRRISGGRSVPATDHGDSRSWWLVLGVDGTHLGCLSLDATHRVEGYVIRVSRLTACPT